MKLRALHLAHCLVLFLHLSVVVGSYSQSTTNEISTSTVSSIFIPQRKLRPHAAPSADTSLSPYTSPCGWECLNGGYCEILLNVTVVLSTNVKSGGTTSSCVCPPGFGGIACEIKLKQCDNSQKTCFNGMPCVLKDGNYVCDCFIADQINPFAGKMCRQPYTNYCSGGPVAERNKGSATPTFFCTNGGTCTQSSVGTATSPGYLTTNVQYRYDGCACVDNFYGPHCEYLNYSSTATNASQIPILSIAKAPNSTTSPVDTGNGTLSPTIIDNSQTVSRDYISRNNSIFLNPPNLGAMPSSTYHSKNTYYSSASFVTLVVAIGIMLFLFSCIIGCRKAWIDHGAEKERSSYDCVRASRTSYADEFQTLRYRQGTHMDEENSTESASISSHIRNPIYLEEVPFLYNKYDYSIESQVGELSEPTIHAIRSPSLASGESTKPDVQICGKMKRMGSGQCISDHRPATNIHNHHATNDDERQRTVDESKVRKSMNNIASKSRRSLRTKPGEPPSTLPDTDTLYQQPSDLTKYPLVQQSLSEDTSDRKLNEIEEEMKQLEAAIALAKMRGIPSARNVNKCSSTKTCLSSRMSSTKSPLKSCADNQVSSPAHCAKGIQRTTPESLFNGTCTAKQKPRRPSSRSIQRARVTDQELAGRTMMLVSGEDDDISVMTDPCYDLPEDEYKWQRNIV
jgi:hypothetical protein